MKKKVGRYRVTSNVNFQQELNCIKHVLVLFTFHSSKSKLARAKLNDSFHFRL